jgi:type I restriction enzyme S subunit
MSWEMVKLGDIATYINGCAFKPSDWSKSGLPIIRIQNLTNQDADYNYFDGKYKSQYEINNGEILISWSATLGVFKWNKGKALLNQHIFKVIFDKKNIDKNYFVYVVNSELQNLIGNTHGSTMKHITKNRFENHLIPLPPLETQKKIVNILDKAQELINKRKQQIDLMDSLVQSLFYDMFGDPVLNPMGWETKTVEKICNQILGGGTPSKNVKEYYTGNIPWVTPKDMKKLLINNSIDKITETAVRNSSTKLIPTGSIIMVIRSGILKKKLPVAINTKEITINQDMKAFIPKSTLVSNYYLLYFFLSVQTFLLSKVRSVTADNIEFKQIKELKIPIPPITLQNNFAKKVKKIETQKQKMQKSLKDLEQNFSSLMQRAFKGEI